MAEGTGKSRISRRSFVKLTAAGGLAAFAGYSGLVYPAGLQKWLTFGRKPWEVDLGVVDYDRVMKVSYGPSELGFAKEIRTSPPEERILNVAQWYDYWPGSVVADFTKYMDNKWGIKGVAVNWTSNIYISNEELFTWVTQTGRKFDVMVPTNYNIETMEKAGLVVNLNKAWIPYYQFIFGKVPLEVPKPFISPTWTDNNKVVQQIPHPALANGYNNEAGMNFRDPTLNGYQYRGNRGTYPNPRGTDHFTWGEDNGLLAVPYQWGTTGIGYRSDVFRSEDIETLGWDVFELTSYTNPEWMNPKTGKPEPRTFDLTKKKMMLDDMREVFTAGLKDVGWKRQLAAGLTPTPVSHGPDASGQSQWSANEISEDKLTAARDWLLTFRQSSFGFNTPQQGPWLVSGTMYFDHSWSGDVMYAIRPNSSLHYPVDWFVPKQGGARWIDNLAIHRECEKLWLSHEFINYIHEPEVQAAISSWNLYGTPNSWAFRILKDDPSYTYNGQNLDGSPYRWNPTEDWRIYSDIALGYNRGPVLYRTEYQKDVGVKNNLKYFTFWRHVKF